MMCTHETNLFLYVTEGGDNTFIREWVVSVLKCIFIVQGVYTIRGPSIGCSCHFLLIDDKRSIFSRNAKWWPSVVVSVKSKI